MENLAVQRSGAEIAAEINIIKKQTARVCLSATVEIGRLLCEAKAAVPFGEWGDWLAQNVAYSQSTANNIMRLYQEYGESEQLGFFEENRMEIFGELTPSQAVALLGLAPAERRSFVEAHDMETVSVRDIQREVKARQEAEALAEKARSELQNTKRLAEELQDRLSEKEAALAVQREQLTQERDRAVAASQLAGNEAIARFSVIFENIQTELATLRELAEQVGREGDKEKEAWLIDCVKALFEELAREW